MLDLPDLPIVLNTRHITCVRCKEKFAVTEGRRTWRQWRQLPDEPLNIRLRHEEARQQQPIVPPPLTEPQQRAAPQNFTESRLADLSLLADVNCPRCGADNRNWLTLNDAANIPQLQLWRRRFPGVFSAGYLGLAFMALALVLIFLMDIHLGKAAVLLLFIPAAIVGVIWEITREWRALRENNHVRHILPKAKSKERELWIRGGALVFLFTIVFPIIFFSLTPTAFRLFLEFTQDSSESEVDASATAVSLVMNQQIDATEEEFAAIAEELQELLDSLPREDLGNFEAEVARLSAKLADTAAASEAALEQIQAESATAIQARREAELAAVTKARNTQIAGLTDGLIADLRFLALWGLAVGPPTLVTVFIAMAAVKGFVARVDRELPFPIFYSVAGMTRLVAWEARQALEINGNHYFDIQWTSVDRNEIGGLDLVGLFRDPPAFDIQGRAKGGLVRAQRHTIHTDKWCRVLNAKIEDVMVPVPAGAPAGIIPQPAQAQHDAPANVRIRLPDR